MSKKRNYYIELSLQVIKYPNSEEIDKDTVVISYRKILNEINIAKNLYPESYLKTIQKSLDDKIEELKKGTIALIEHKSIINSEYLSPNSKLIDQINKYVLDDSVMEETKKTTCCENISIKYYSIKTLIPLEEYEENSSNESELEGLGHA